MDVGGLVRTLPPEGEDGYRVVVVSNAPQIAFTAPGPAEYVSGTTIIRGTMNHETGNEPDITLRFSLSGDPTALLEVAKPPIVVTGPAPFDWEYTLDSSSLPNGTIVAQAFAELGGTTGFNNLVFLVDNDDPTVNITYPGYLATVYGQVTIRGTASDNSSVETVEIKVGKDQPFVPVSGTYNWQHTIDSNFYGAPLYADEWNPITNLPAVGTGIWRLPIEVRVTDSAGSEAGILHYVYIDQDQDKPSVTVFSPAGGSNLAGPVLVSGIAFDADPGVQRVEMQIVAITDADEVIGNVSPSGDAMANFDWHVVTGTTQWSQEINSNGRLYSVTAVDGAYEGSPLPHNGRLRLRIRAVDGNGKVGNTQEIAIRLDDSIPSIFGITPASGSCIRGVFQLTASVTDDEQLVDVAVSVNGGISYSSVYSGPLANYNLDYQIDTATSGLDIISQVRSIWIRARDNANYTTVSTVSLNIDNWWPDGELVTTTWDPQEMAGDEFEIRGEAWDRDRLVADNQYPVRGIDTIDVYFEDRRPSSLTIGEFYNLSGGATILGDYEDIGNSQGVKPIVTSDDHRIRIDRTHVGTDDFKAIEPEGSDSTWWTRIDSTELPDGQMRVHYLFTDRAGNQTHRTEDGFVKNNPPVIGTVTVGSDLNYSGSVTSSGPAEQFPYSGMRFNTRQLLYVSPTISGGNPTTSWQLFNSTNMLIPLVLTGNTLDISGYSDGNYTFVVRATDGVGIVVDQNLLVRIDQDDATAPSITIGPLPAAVSGHIEGESPHTPGRPSVSGMVTISGSADDNQRIKEIRITAPGIGTNVLAAQWVDNPTYNLMSQLTGFTVLTSSITEAGGHQVTWSYAWDTATHPDRAALGVTFSASVQDFRTGLPAAVSASRTYDVVPYITSIVNNGTAGVSNDVLRSSTGKYSVDQSSVTANYLIPESV
jgi:hypothetical protein